MRNEKKKSYKNDLTLFWDMNKFYRKREKFRY